MRKLVCVLLASFQWGISASAAPALVNKTIVDPRFGEIKIVVKDPQHYAPLAVMITVKCNDNRLSKTPARPKPVRVEDRAICAWGGFSFNESESVLVYRFGEASEQIADDSCETKPEASVDLKKICEAWNR